MQKNLAPASSYPQFADCIVQIRLPPQKFSPPRQINANPSALAAATVASSGSHLRMADRVVLGFHHSRWCTRPTPSAEGEYSATYSASSPKPFSKSAKLQQISRAANRARKSAARCCERRVAEA